MALWYGDSAAIMRLLTTKKERLIKMKPPRAVSKMEKIIFPIVGLLLTAFIVPSGLPAPGYVIFREPAQESGVTRRLAETHAVTLIDIVTILIGLTVGCSTQADKFLHLDSVLIFGLGAMSFVVATAAGVLFV
jgi:oxaloacetate decarboxylase beta subunit